MKVNSTDTSPLNIKLPFPPQITSSNLIEKAVTKLRTSGKTSRIPNGFLCYRMAFCKELQALKHPVITQPQLSALAKQSWLKEPEHVRTEYQKIAAEAKNIYKQSCIEQKLILHEQKNKLKNVQESSPATANFNYSTSTASSSSSSPETKNLNNLHFSLQKFTENGPFTNTELYPNFHTSGTTPFSYNYPNFFCHQLLTPEKTRAKNAMEK
ncbi:5950_t:CDS:2 [Ambispora leptoticha]|uniref:5950_t:CDS:1 n=1 Tax=Ambispora leptoticha TaxID=144679 RepID=A0A9N9AV74_9GLOM|nr:5950_t:CDS:2 [Ambispora leptoticha]